MRARAAIALFELTASAAAADGWNVEAYGGAPLNVSTPLSIEQSGQPTLRTTARYETRPFEAPWYYHVHIGRWSGKAEWAVELTHHKIFLTNPPSEVGAFGASHGYNLLTANRGWELPFDIWARVGLGVVISHPESTVRGQAFGENGGFWGLGYYLSGAAATAAIQKRVYLVGGFFIAAEGMISASYAVLPVVDGHARAPNVALHALLGLGYRFGSGG
jgi:hypothetical protein